MLELIITYADQIYAILSALASECWTGWVTDPKPYRFCYAGLFGLYLAGYCGAAHRQLHGFGAVLYLALYLA